MGVVTTDIFLVRVPQQNGDSLNATATRTAYVWRRGLQHSLAGVEEYRAKVVHLARGIVHVRQLLLRGTRGSPAGGAVAAEAGAIAGAQAQRAGQHARLHVRNRRVTCRKSLDVPAHPHTRHGGLDRRRDFRRNIVAFDHGRCPQLWLGGCGAFHLALRARHWKTVRRTARRRAGDVQNVRPWRDADGHVARGLGQLLRSS